MQITTDTGNVTVSGDGDSVTVESDEGAMQSGAGTKVPAPDAVPLPSGDLQTSIKANDAFNLIYKVSDPKKAFGDYVKALESAGFELSDKTEGVVNDQLFGSVSTEGKGWRLQVGVVAGEEQVLALTVEPAS